MKVECQRVFPDCGIHTRTICECCKVILELEDIAKDMNRLIQKAGDVIGTDPNYRSVACIDIALDYLKMKMNEGK